MNNKYFVFLRDGKMYIRVRGQEEVLEYFFEDIGSYPNVPFYSCIIEDKKASRKLLRLVRKSLNGVNLLKFILLKPKVFLLMPDDAIEIENRFLQEFMVMSFRANQVFCCYEASLARDSDVTSYICISQSCRMLVLTYVKDGGPYARKYLENRDYSAEELKKLIYELHPQCRADMLNIYLNGSHLSKYSSIGTVIPQDRLMDNFFNALKDIRLKRVK